MPILRNGWHLPHRLRVCETIRNPNRPFNNGSDGFPMIQGGCYGENFSWNIDVAWNRERLWIPQGGLGEKGGDADFFYSVISVIPVTPKENFTLSFPTFFIGNPSCFFSVNNH